MKIYDNLKDENQKLNNDIKVLFKENRVKEKVIIKYNNVLYEIKGIIYNTNLTGIEVRIAIQEVLDKYHLLEESD